MTAMSDFVAETAQKFAGAEDAVNAAYNAALKLPPLMKDAREVGLVGFLQSERAKNDLRAAAGKIADGLALILAVHREGTLVAQEKGVDLPQPRSEEHTSELQSHACISYAVFCLDRKSVV